MSETCNKEHATQLNPEELGQVTGGAGSWYTWDGKCPFCGSTNTKYIPYAHTTICTDCKRGITAADLP